MTQPITPNIVFEVGNTYQSMNSNATVMRVVKRTKCFITFEVIIDGVDVSNVTGTTKKKVKLLEIVDDEGSVKNVEYVDGNGFDNYQADEVPSEEVPSEEVPSEEVPSEEVPSEEVPSDIGPEVITYVTGEVSDGDAVPSEEVPSEDVYMGPEVITYVSDNAYVSPVKGTNSLFWHDHTRDIMEALITHKVTTYVEKNIIFTLRSYSKSWTKPGYFIYPGLIWEMQGDYEKPISKRGAVIKLKDAILAHFYRHEPTTLLEQEIYDICNTKDSKEYTYDCPLGGIIEDIF